MTNQPQFLQFARWGALISALLTLAFALFTPLFFGAIDPTYQHMRDYISELGAVGAANANAVNWFGFLPTGLLASVFVLFTLPLLPKHNLAPLAAILWLVAMGVGYIGATIFPCDLGCPTEGSLNQQLHNTLGLFEYGLGGISLILFSLVFWQVPSARWLSILAAMFALSVWLGLVNMADPAQSDWRGGWQRIAEVALFGWMMALTWWIFRHTSPSAITIQNKPA